MKMEKVAPEEYLENKEIYKWEKKKKEPSLCGTSSLSSLKLEGKN